MKDYLKKGVRIFYHGDMANDEGLGTITNRRTDSWGTFVDVKMDDGRKFALLSIALFSEEYEGHGGTRFVTEEAYRKFRQAAMRNLEKDLNFGRRYGDFDRTGHFFRKSSSIEKLEKKLKRDCEFMVDGRLRGGRIIKETKLGYVVGYHDPTYREIELLKDKVKLL